MAQQQRRLLCVAPPGSTPGDGETFPTVQAAVHAVPLGNRARTVIRLAPGVYREPVYVAKTKNLVTLAGASAEATVISWDNTATRIKHAQEYNAHYVPAVPSSLLGVGDFVPPGQMAPWRGCIPVCCILKVFLFQNLQPHQTPVFLSLVLFILQSNRDYTALINR
ncbi:hypothetical protein ACQ4PT_048213 [Festuca glaucescens]